MNLSKVIKLNISVVLLHSCVFKLRTAKFEKEISGYYIVFSFLCILWWWSHIRTQDNDINALALELHTTMDEESVKVACKNHVNNPVFCFDLDFPNKSANFTQNFFCLPWESCFVFICIFRATFWFLFYFFFFLQNHISKPNNSLNHEL